MRPSFEFFVDENLGVQFRSELRDLGLVVRTHQDLNLPKGCSDSDWIVPVAENGWPAFTLDTRVGRNNPMQMKLIRSAGLADFHISNKLPVPADQVYIVERHLDLILVVAWYLPRPYRVGLTKTGANLQWWGESAEALLTRPPKILDCVEEWTPD